MNDAFSPGADMLRELAGKAASGRLALPSVPRVVCSLIEQLNAPDIDVGDFAAELEQEPQLAARVLRIANSAQYAGRRSVASVNEAIAVVGTQALRTLVIGCGLQSAFVRIPSVNLRQFWFDATRCAQLARRMAGLWRRDAEAAYLAGLLHGAGHLILVQALGPLPEDFLPTVLDLRGAELFKAETAAWGVGHPAVGAAWLDELGLPEEIVQAVAMQLEPGGSPPDGLARLLALALTLCTSANSGDSVDVAFSKLDPVFADAVVGGPGNMADVLAPIYRELLLTGGWA